MSEAIFGLVGVVVGGVLNAAMTYMLDLQREKREIRSRQQAAQAAARLLLFEVSNSGLRMSEALSQRSWGPIQRGIVTEEWARHREAIANAFVLDDWLKVWVGQRAIEETRSLAASKTDDAGMTDHEAKRVKELSDTASRFATALIDISTHGPHGAQEERTRRARLRAERGESKPAPSDDEIPF